MASSRGQTQKKLKASSSSSLPTSVPPLMKIEEPINWAELPRELTALILHRLGVIEILNNAHKVCRSWRRVCKDPSMWRKIDLQIPRNRHISVLDIDGLRDRGISDLVFDSMCRHAVDRSEGGLVEINIRNIVTDSLLTYIADRSSKLRSLGLVMCYPMSSKGLVNAVSKLPLLEVLEVSPSWLKLDLKAIGNACPQLKTLKLISSGYGPSSIKCDDDDALAIAESMPKLRHLQLFGNGLTNTGLNSILDGCPHLEHLDLHRCFNICLAGDLEKRCFERIKSFRHPNDLTADCPFDTGFVDIDVDDASELIMYSRLYETRH